MLFHIPGMNRHHYALFVHNTKLVFVLRKESEESNDLEKFSPAEWRWDLDEVNDGLWHHYALSMDFPQVGFKFVLPQGLNAGMVI